MNEVRHAGWLGATVADLMRRDVVTVSPSTPIDDLIALFRQHGISGVPVVNERKKAIGMVSETDLTWLMDRFVTGEGNDTPANLHEMTVEEVMTADVFGVAPEATISQLAAFFARNGLGRAVVLEEGEVRGVVSVIDLLRVFANGR
jgi:CBS domain-containing protein